MIFTLESWTNMRMKIIELCSATTVKEKWRGMKFHFKKTVAMKKVENSKRSSKAKVRDREQQVKGGELMNSL